MLFWKKITKISNFFIVIFEILQNVFLNFWKKLKYLNLRKKFWYKWFFGTHKISWNPKKITKFLKISKKNFGLKNSWVPKNFLKFKKIKNGHIFRSWGGGPRTKKKYINLTIFTETKLLSYIKNEIAIDNITVVSLVRIPRRNAFIMR